MKYLKIVDTAATLYIPESAICRVVEDSAGLTFYLKEEHFRGHGYRSSKIDEDNRLGIYTYRTKRTVWVNAHDIVVTI